MAQFPESIFPQFFEPSSPAPGDVRDQTQMYRCTVSHESEPLAQLVRCFERRGIFDCDAQRFGEKDGTNGGFRIQRYMILMI